MKNYYQQKKGGWNLEPVIYAKTVKEIRCYHFFREMIDRISMKSPEMITEKDILDRMVAQRYVEAVDNGLRYFVPEEYRKAVFEHFAEETEYEELEEKYFLSAAAMKRYAQVFVWGVAEELGENFRPVRH